MTFVTPPRNRILLRLRRALILTAAVGLSAFTVQAQEEPRAVETSIRDVRVKLSGTFQPRFSYGFTTNARAGEDELQRLGFGIRRARLRATATFMSRFGVHYDMELGGGSLSTVDAYGFYRPGSDLSFKAGYFAGAQPESAAFTSHTRIDAIERAAIANLWARNTIGSSARDFGFEVRYQPGDANFQLFVHNGDQSFDRRRGNFREGVESLSTTRGVDRTGIAVSGYANYEPEAVPGLDIGGFASYNGAPGPATFFDGRDEERRYVSYSGHLYWGARPGSQPVRLKADAIGIRYDGLDRVGTSPSVDTQHSIGFSLLGAARVLRHGEVFARAERFYLSEDAEPDDYVTAGVSYSLSARRGLAYRQERLTLAYANALPGEAAIPIQHIIVLQFQFVF